MIIELKSEIWSDVVAPGLGPPPFWASIPHITALPLVADYALTTIAREDHQYQHAADEHHDFQLIINELARHIKRPTSELFESIAITHRIISLLHLPIIHSQHPNTFYIKSKKNEVLHHSHDCRYRPSRTHHGCTISGCKLKCPRRGV